MSTALADTGPQPAAAGQAVPSALAIAPSTAPVSSTAPAPPAAQAPAPAAAASSAVPGAGRGRPHLVAFDLIRLIIMAFVVGVHTLSFGAGRVTVPLGAFTVVFHTSRELFFLLTALVLAYNYGHREHVRWVRFVWRRYRLVVPAYVAWTLIYYAFDGPGRGAFPAAIWHDLLYADARYHLYFLLVSMQVYLAFPVLRWVLRTTAGYHGWLFGVAFAYQVGLTAVLHYHLVHGGPLAGFLNGAAQGTWMDSYLFYIIGGAIAGWHFERICAVTRRYASVRTVALAAGAGVLAGVGTYLVQMYLFGARPGPASGVFQPVVAVETLAFGWALLAAGLLWSDRGAPRRQLFAAGAASSFGIYLAHPLLLQGVLFAANASGLLAVARGGPSVAEVLFLLGVVVPVVYAGAWIIASAARRTPASLALTGREYQRRPAYLGRHAAGAERGGAGRPGLPGTLAARLGWRPGTRR